MNNIKCMRYHRLHQKAQRKSLYCQVVHPIRLTDNNKFELSFLKFILHVNLTIPLFKIIIKGHNHANGGPKKS